MSGTSLDGVDAAIIQTDGERLTAFAGNAFEPYTTDEREAVIGATHDALAWDGDGERPSSFAEVDALVADIHIRTARRLLDLCPHTVSLIGFHGQTVLHRPARALSVQLGDAFAIARALGIAVIAGMRQADLDAGGEGAPIAPLYHRALARWAKTDGAVCFLNVGGVANLTYIGEDESIMACDTGPGNGLIDLMLQDRGLARYDEDGRFSAQGTVDPAVLKALFASPYFTRQGPRSLDRYDFPLAPLANLSAQDAAATLVAFTADAVGLAADRLPTRPVSWFVCGGGRHNPSLMRAFEERLGDCRSIDAIGLNGDFIEAEAMAFLAARSARGLALTLPETTGAPAPICGGVRFDP
ncbi:anhydro-N-acetylmuramic acid kinase (plasmid) [Croceicoccus marinus]|uniref:Anhydro-N-acetylmuramic acid kinase n=2 Tax=Croceicoccus marinus TaxID=450378 RepID=A0A7G6W127_9SPHN|nr:anhydro-N-acetylmuramic acid kinase [Croceicoccus marinus]